MKVLDDELKNSIHLIGFLMENSGVPLLPDPPVHQNGDTVKIRWKIFWSKLPCCDPPEEGTVTVSVEKQVEKRKFRFRQHHES